MENIKFEAVKKISDLHLKIKDLTKLSRIDTISPPSVFVGSKLNYPLVNVGILSPVEKVENAKIFDDSKTWAQQNFSIQEIIGLRENLLNSRFQSNVKDVRSNKKFIELAKNIALALNPVDVEIEFNNKIDVSKRIDKVLTPNGMSVNIKNAKITSNIKISDKVERAMNDELKADEGLNYLYKSGINEYDLSKILSVGALGLKKDKKIVPTKWSITATDDMLAKDIIERIRGYKWVEDYGLLFGEFLGNQYIILLFPGPWTYELFEVYYPFSSWNPTNEFKASTDFENFYGRTDYAKNCAGGYYASRFPIVEYLDSLKKQASVLVIRLETPSYWAGLGVWVVRESVRKAIEKGQMNFSSKEEFLDGVKKIAKIKYNFDIDLILKKSQLLHFSNVQKRIYEWF